MSVVITIITGVAIGVIVAVVGGLINRSLLRSLTNKEAKDAEGEVRSKAIANGVLALLHNELYPMLENAYFRGVVGYDEFDNIAHLFEPYKALGGNGTLERRFRQVDDLERVKDEELEDYSIGKKKVMK